VAHSASTALVLGHDWQSVSMHIAFTGGTHNWHLTLLLLLLLLLLLCCWKVLTGCAGWKARHMMQLSVGMNLSGLLPDIRPGRERFQVAIAPGSTHQPDTSNL